MDTISLIVLIWYIGWTYSIGLKAGHNGLTFADWVISAFVWPALLGYHKGSHTK